MSSIAESRQLIEGIVKLRRAERFPAVAADVSPVRRDLEARVGPALSRSRAALILGVSQTALDRWVTAGQIPIVLTPSGRRQVPRQFVVELRESMDELRAAGRGHPLSVALEARREAAEKVTPGSRGAGPSTPQGHETPERRSRAFHRLVAERLDQRMVEEARERVERLEEAGHLRPRYAERWRDLFARPLAEIATAISADDEAGRDLRQNSPFAGVLNEQERRRIIETVR